ncbi:hypothetical protein IAD21_06029 [Abditibacteriota bacterium]|nr:hypothetical protein IAD21_06029 [Abditibacteriota bacterium]
MTMNMLNSPPTSTMRAPSVSSIVGQPSLVLPASHPRLRACFELRYRYFVEERGWVAANPDEPGVERDSYDDEAIHVAVQDGNGIAAYLRMLPFRSETGFMIDSEFSGVLSDEARQNLPRKDSLELSRLVVRSGFQLQSGMQVHPLELLFKQFYQESKARGFERFYIVVEPGWIRLFARNFGVVFRVMGQPYTFPDGTKAVAAAATLQELQEGMRRHSTMKWNWYEQEES